MKDSNTKTSSYHNALTNAKKNPAELLRQG